MIRLEDVNFDYKKPADKFLHKHEGIRKRFQQNILKILNKDHPEQFNVKPLQGRLKGYLRMVINDFRIIYTIEHGEIIIVDVAFAGPRGDVYKRFQG